MFFKQTIKSDKEAANDERLPLVLVLGGSRNRSTREMKMEVPIVWEMEPVPANCIREIENWGIFFSRTVDHL